MNLKLALLYETGQETLLSIVYTLKCKPNFRTGQIVLYSVLKLFAGFVKAALAEWNIAVAAAAITITKADTINGNTDKPVL